MKKIKVYECSHCGGLSEKIGTAHDYQGGDPCICLICGTIEPGFHERDCLITVDIPKEARK